MDRDTLRALRQANRACLRTPILIGSADTLGIPINTVKSQLHRALAMLREKMQFMEGETLR